VVVLQYCFSAASPGGRAAGLRTFEPPGRFLVRCPQRPLLTAILQV